MLGDKAYDSAELREELDERGTKPVIPTKPAGGLAPEHPACATLPDAAVTPPPPVISDAASGAPAATIDLQITVVQGGITNAKVPVVIGACYDGLAL